MVVILRQSYINTNYLNMVYLFLMVKISTHIFKGSIFRPIYKYLPLKWYVVSKLVNETQTMTVNFNLVTPGIIDKIKKLHCCFY